MDPHKSTDLTRTLDLVRRAQEGDRASLEQLFARYYDRVQKVVRARLGPHIRTFSESGDIVQDACIEAFRAFDRFEARGEASFLNWVAKIAENRIRRAAEKRTQNKNHVWVQATLEQINDRIASGDLRLEPSADIEVPVEHLEREEHREIVQGGLGDLRPDYREVIVLRTYLKADWAFIAAELGSPSPNAARMLYGRALIELTRRVRPRLSE